MCKSVPPHPSLSQVRWNRHAVRQGVYDLLWSFSFLVFYWPKKLLGAEEDAQQILDPFLFLGPFVVCLTLIFWAFGRRAWASLAVVVYASGLYLRSTITMDMHRSCQLPSAVLLCTSASPLTH